MTTTSKRIVLVGHCSPDSSHLTMAVTGALPGAKVIRTHDDKGVEQAMADGADLLLVNRAMEPGYGHGDGNAYIRDLKARRPDARVMLVSNYPDAQAAAVEAGALPGFGKSELMTERVKQLLRDAVGATVSR